MMLKDNSYKNFTVKMDCQLSFFLNIPHRTKGLQCLEVYLCQPEHTSCKDTYYIGLIAYYHVFIISQVITWLIKQSLLLTFRQKESNKFNS